MYGDNTVSSTGIGRRDKEFHQILASAAGKISSRLKNYDEERDPLTRSHLKLLWDLVMIEAERVESGESRLYTGLESPIRAVADWGEPQDSELLNSLKDAESFFRQNYGRRNYTTSASHVFAFFLLGLFIAIAGLPVLAQDNKDKDALAGNAVMWEAVDVKSRDLFLGPGGTKLAPDLDGAVVVGRQAGGNNTKYRLRDNDGHEWIAKIADESQPEAAAVRLLWAIGYKTEVNYLIPELKLGKHGTFSNVRLEARPKGTKRGDRWLWKDNPFVGTREFDGLKLMMAMLNNWDLKDENNVIIIADGQQQYVVSDLGASFGKLAESPNSRAGRSVNDVDGYAKSVFIKGTRDGVIDLAYTGAAQNLMDGIKVEHGRWLADLLTQLTDKQIRDAFRAARYSDEKAGQLAAAFRARIDALDRATQTAVAAN